jgi:hypothetical protein
VLINPVSFLNGERRRIDNRLNPFSEMEIKELSEKASTANVSGKLQGMGTLGVVGGQLFFVRREAKFCDVNAS